MVRLLLKKSRDREVLGRGQLIAGSRNLGPEYRLTATNGSVVIHCCDLGVHSGSKSVQSGSLARLLGLPLSGPSLLPLAIAELKIASALAGQAVLFETLVEPLQFGKPVAAVMDR